MNFDNMKKPIFIVMLAALLIGGVVWLFYSLSQDDEVLSETVQTQPSVTDVEKKPTTEDEEPDPAPQKESNQGSTNDQEVEKRPVVATGYGNSPDKPLPEGQQTSTTCTTDAGVECVLVFKSGSQTITFDTKTTNSQGVAVWNWTGGEEVSSGNWEVSATAGDKTSMPGVIYVQ